MPFNHDTGQAIITYILLLTNPIFVYHLSSMLMPTSPQEAHTLARVFFQHPNIHGSSFQRRLPHKHWKKIKRKLRVRMRMSDNKHTPWPTYLWPLLWKLFQAGCCVEHSLRKWLKWIRQAGSPARHKATCLAFQAEDSGARVRFDTDSIPIGVDNHASRCMANDKCLFEDLHLDQSEQQVGGINDGLVIAGRGTMVITINDDSGRPHKIKIPNSLFLPDLRVCLLLPQHWA